MQYFGARSIHSPRRPSHGSEQRSQSGPKKDIVLFNAAAAIIVSGNAKDFVEGIEKADEAICNGNAMHCLDKLIEISNSGAPV